MSSTKPSNFTSTIAGGAILISLIGIISKGLGILRETIFARYFGLSSEFDLYLVANVIPVMLTTVFFFFCQNYFIPIYNTKKKESTEKLNNFFTLSIIFFTVIGIAITALLFIFSAEVISLFVDSSNSVKFDLALNIFQILLVIIPLGFTIAVLSSKLQAEFNFRTPAYAQLILNISIIIFVLIFAQTYGVKSIVIGYVVGTLLQLLYTFLKSKGVFNFSRSIIDASAFKEFLTPGILLILFVEIFGQIFFLADRILYKYVDDGGIAALNYSYTVFNLPISVFSVAFSTVLISKFSNLVSNDNKTEVNSSLNKFFAINLFLFVPIFLIFIFEGQLLISILFEHGNFDSASASITFSSLKYLSLSLLFISSYSGINKLIYSHRFLKEMFIISFITVLIKFILNFILVKDLQQDGLALSSAVCYSLLFFLGFIVLVKKKIIDGASEFVRNLIIVLSIGLLSYYLVQIVSQHIFSEAFVTRIILTFIFLVIFTITAFVLKHSSVELLLSTFNYFKTEKKL